MKLYPHFSVFNFLSKDHVISFYRLAIKALRYTADVDWERYFLAFSKESGWFSTIKYAPIDLTLEEDANWLIETPID